MLNFSQTQEPDVEQVDIDEEDFLETDALDLQTNLDWLSDVEDSCNQMEYVNMFLSGDFSEEQLVELLPDTVLLTLGELCREYDGDVDAIVQMLFDSSVGEMIKGADNLAEVSEEAAGAAVAVGSATSLATIIAVSVIIKRIVLSNKFWAQKIKDNLTKIKEDRINTIKSVTLPDYDVMLASMQAAAQFRAKITQMAGSFDSITDADLEKLITVGAAMAAARSSIKEAAVNDLLKALALIGLGFSVVNKSFAILFAGSLVAQQAHRYAEGKKTPLAQRGWKSLQEYRTMGNLFLAELAETENTYSVLTKLIRKLKLTGRLSPLRKNALKSVAKLFRYHLTFVHMHKQHFARVLRKLSR